MGAAFGPSGSEKDPKLVSPGTWGGQGIRLEIGDSDAAFELDCAHGRIGTPMRTDEEGRFVAAGVFVREAPGPIRPGRDPQEQPATYSGSIRDGTMELTIALTDSRETVGAYTLVRGSEGRVRKCR